MGILQNSVSGFKSLVSGGSSKENLGRDVKTLDDFEKLVKKSGQKVLPWKSKAVSKTQKDIGHWKRAIANATAEDYPTNFQLQALFDEAMDDLHVTSQTENRNNKTLGSQFSLKDESNEVDEDQTKLLANSSIFRDITTAILNKRYYGYSMGEISFKRDVLGKVRPYFELTPRANITPVNGKFYFDYTDQKTIDYRELEQYGIFILEFNDKSLGLLNKIVPLAMFKKFAMSCWSELGEIYGIPPRYMKTNTQDPKMLNRAEQMMRDMGSAAWFIIDDTEEFEFAKGIDANGDIYNNLIRAIDNQISLAISGAVVGQDTKNGSNGKEQTSQELLEDLVLADKEMVMHAYNEIVIPALTRLGVLKGELTFEWDPIEDTSELWERTKDSLQYFEVDQEWFKSKFGVQITGAKAQNKTLGEQLKSGESFFV